MKTEVAAALNVIRAVADTVKELGEVPAGELYARLMPVMDLDRFNQVVGILERSSVIRKNGHLLVWNVQ